MKPDRLLFCDKKSWNGDALIEALFAHNDTPILFRARVGFEDRSFEADIFSTNESTAEQFMVEELLEACFCSGHMQPENEQHTDQTRHLMELCEVPSENNNNI